MSSDEGEDGYVHRPSGEPPAEGDSQREFDWRGWTLVATVVFAFLVVPGALLYLPFAQSFVTSLGLQLRDAYLVLPLVPAFLLGAVAVWSAVRARADG
jgi:ABC-type glycerol-3-phosphate transport system permease component